MSQPASTSVAGAGRVWLALTVSVLAMLWGAASASASESRRGEPAPSSKSSVRVAPGPVAAVRARNDTAVKPVSARAKPAKVSKAGRPDARKTAQKTAKPRVKAVVGTSGRKVSAQRKAARPTARARVPAEPPRLSVAQQAGLHATPDALDLRSAVALVVDQDTQEVLYSKNEQAVLPIASLTKLMTAIVVREARLPDEDVLVISQDDVDTEKGSGSRLRVGTRLTRAEALHLALMSSENRAAHALGRTYPGGLSEFVRRMNDKARELGMNDTRFVEPTGLSSRNQSSAHDLATLVGVAYQDPVLREFSTSHGHQVEVGNRVVQYNNTNRLVKNPDWNIGLQKTGYISEAGRCLVMQARISGRQLIMVFLDSAGKLTRLGDAERVRQWVEHNLRSEAPLNPSVGNG